MFDRKVTENKATCYPQYGTVSTCFMICFCICFIIFSAGCGSKLLHRENPVGKLATIEVVDVSQEPEQVDISASTPFVMKIIHGSLSVTPKAKYHIAAMIVGVREYSSGWNSQISPADLALAWGGLAAMDYDTYIEYEQRGRWYYYKFNKMSPFDKRYIGSHSANNHIIPATDNIKNIIAKLQVKQIVALEGYLVNVDGVYEGEKVWWHSSLTREDSGDGACELMYVNKIVVNGLVYE